MSPPYHTALRRDDPPAAPLDKWAGRDAAAFQHDVMDGLPACMASADVIYSEIPWRDGYDEFYRRAGVTPALSYDLWCRRLADEIEVTHRPAVIVGGYAAMRAMNRNYRPVRLNGSVAAAILFRPFDLPQGILLSQFVTTADLLAILAMRFESVADPCAGYGAACWAFADRGKPFMAADINPDCIGYIAAEGARRGC